MHPSVTCLLGLAVLAGPLTAQRMSTVAASRELRGEAELAVHVRFGLGTFSLSRDQTGALYRARLLYDQEHFRPVHEYDADSRQLEFGVKSLRENVNLKNRDDIVQELELAVAPSVLTTLDLEFGAGRADVDLGGMSIRSAAIKTGASEAVIAFSRPTIAPCEKLEIKVGAAEFRGERLGNSNCDTIDVDAAAGKFTLDFTGEWQHSGTTNADITIGLGDLELRFPSHLGVTISLDRFLASFDDAGFVKRGDTFYSTGYDDAPAKLHIDLKAVVGDVDVVWVQR